MRRIVTIWGLLLLAITGVIRGDESPQKPLRILFVGNSYTNGSWQAINAVFKTEDPRVVLQKQTAGGAKLADWAKRPPLLKLIRDGNWDYVVLQEQSQLPSLPGKFAESFFDAAAVLDKEVRASGAQTVFFMTWGRRNGDRHNREINPDFETMQQRLSASYRSVAERHDAVLAPVGEAYAEIRKLDPDLFAQLYQGDGSHPAVGAFVVAYCLYRAIYGQLPDKHFHASTARTPRAGRGMEVDSVRTIHKAVRSVFEPPPSDVDADQG
jgi:hypothetical protein